LGSLARRSLPREIERGIQRRALHLPARKFLYEADLVDQLFNTSERRLARILLLLAHFGKESRAELVLPRVSQANLAQMVGTTRSRVSYFMNRFRKLGFIDYNDQDGLTVHSDLLGVLLNGQIAAIGNSERRHSKKSQ
jgi:CRP-like cAMP-binding protein